MQAFPPKHTLIFPKVEQMTSHLISLEFYKHFEQYTMT